MTWLTGQTTWQNVVGDLHKLIAGEMADGTGTTAAAGDKWVRPVAGQDFLVSPASSAVALGNMNGRAGYWQCIGATSTYGPFATVCKTTAIGTGAVTPTRWGAVIQVTRANTTAGNYSTAQFNLYIFDLDANNTYYNGGYSPAADGTWTGSATYTGNVQLTDPSGILPVGAVFARTYTTTYRGGIDFLSPLYGRRAAAPTFSAAPPGVQGTDWALAEITTLRDYSAFVSYLNSNFAQGIGVMTNTYLTGALYTYTFSAALHSMRMIQNASNAGQIDCFWSGGFALDGSTPRTYLSPQIGTWLRPYQTPTAVTNASLIQYWISVKPDKVVIVLNADPGQSGKMTVAAMGTYTPLASSVDKFPVWCSDSAVDYTADVNPVNHVRYWMSPNGQRKRQDGSAAAVRDWQTGWSRTDWAYVGNAVAYPGSTDVESGIYPYQTSSLTLFDPSNASSSSPALIPSRQPKPSGLDGNWWFYGWPIVRASSGNSTQAGMESYAPFGTVTDRVLVIPGDGWANGDEAAESGGRTWLLVLPDYTGVPGRQRIATNNFAGGIAILEE